MCNMDEVKMNSKYLTMDRGNSAALRLYTTLIGYYSGKIVELVKNSYCQTCIFWKGKVGIDKYEEWYQQHKEYSANHSDAAGKWKSTQSKKYMRWLSRSME